MSPNNPKYLEVVTHQSKSGSRASVLLAAANCYKDRLNSLQKTEWQVYYAVWLLLLSSTYFFLSGSGSLLLVIGEMLTNCGWIEPVVLLSRATGFGLVAFLFYAIVYDYYFCQFYCKSYESLVNARTLYEYYLHLAIHEAYEEYIPLNELPLGVPAFKYRVTPQDGRAELNGYPLLKSALSNFIETITFRKLPCNRNSEKAGKEKVEGVVLVTSPIGLTQDPFRNREGVFKVENDYVPYVLWQQGKNYSMSEIFVGRRRAVLNFVIFSVLLVFAVGLFYPVHKGEQNSDIIITVPRSTIR